MINSLLCALLHSNFLLLLILLLLLCARRLSNYCIIEYNYCITVQLMYYYCTTNVLKDGVKNKNKNKTKHSNHLRSHSRAVMVLDHSGLYLENKFLENKSGRIFCFRQVYFIKSCQQIRGYVNQPFILFTHHI